MEEQKKRQESRYLEYKERRDKKENTIKLEEEKQEKEFNEKIIEDKKNAEEIQATTRKEFIENVDDSKRDIHKKLYFIFKKKIPDGSRYEKRRNRSVHKALDTYYNRLSENIKNYMVKTGKYIKLLNKQLQYEKTQNYKLWGLKNNKKNLEF